MSPADTPAVAPAAPAPASTPQRRAAPKSARRRAREFALQSLYQWLVAGAPVREIEAHVAQLEASLDGRQRAGVGGLDDAGFLGEQLGELPRRRPALLVRRGQLDELLDGGEQQAEVEQGGEQKALGIGLDPARRHRRIAFAQRPGGGPGVG